MARVQSSRHRAERPRQEAPQTRRGLSWLLPGQSRRTGSLSVVEAEVAVQGDGAVAIPTGSASLDEDRILTLLQPYSVRGAGGSHAALG